MDDHKPAPPPSPTQETAAKIWTPELFAEVARLNQRVTPDSDSLSDLLERFYQARADVENADYSDQQAYADAKGAATSEIVALYTRQREEIEEARKILAGAIDRDESKWDESLRVLATLASNGIYWRDKEIASLSSQLERLREEIERLRRNFEQAKTNSETNERLLDRALRDVERLKADSLTPAEFSIIESAVLNMGHTISDDTWRSIEAKLCPRLSSDSGTGVDNEAR